MALVASFLGLVLVACSSTSTEISPEEKRNNFDLCVLDYIARNDSSISSIRDSVKERAPVACRDKLK